MFVIMLGWKESTSSSHICTNLGICILKQLKFSMLMVRLSNCTSFSFSTCSCGLISKILLLQSWNKGIASFVASFFYFIPLIKRMSLMRIWRSAFSTLPFNCIFNKLYTNLSQSEFVFYTQFLFSRIKYITSHFPGFEMC